MSPFAFKIPDSPVRGALARALDVGWDCYNRGVDPPEINETLAQSIGSIAGVKILAPGEYAQDHDNCATYTFSVRGRQPWASSWRRGGVPRRLWNDGIAFLGEHRYTPTRDPQPEDVIAYAMNAAHRPILHFGVYEGVGYVASKFGIGPVLYHPIGAVDGLYGSQGMFFSCR